MSAKRLVVCAVLAAAALSSAAADAPPGGDGGHIDVWLDRKLNSHHGKKDKAHANHHEDTKKEKKHGNTKGTPNLKQYHDETTDDEHPTPVSIAFSILSHFLKSHGGKEVAVPKVPTPEKHAKVTGPPKESYHESDPPKAADLFKLSADKALPIKG